MSADAIGQVLGPTFKIVADDGFLALKHISLPLGAKILDIGTGKGLFAIYLASQGYKVLTGEPASDATRYSKRDWAVAARISGVESKIAFQNFDAEDLPFQNGAFDAVFFFGVLHHIAEENREKVLSEAMRVAGGSGCVVFFEPRPAMLKRIWKEDPGHPQAANPSWYLNGLNVHEQCIEGSYMNISIFRSVPHPVQLSLNACAV